MALGPANVSGLIRRRWPWLIAGAAATVTAASLLVSTLTPPTCGTSVAAIGCANPTLVPSKRSSLVVAYGRLTGGTRVVWGTIDHQMRLDHVVVLAGATRPDTVYGWLSTAPYPSPNLAAAQVPGLWATDGRLLAQLPAHPERPTETSTLEVRPIVNDQVVFSAAACSGAPEALSTRKYKGPPLAEVPASRSYTVARCNGGFTSSTLSDVERSIK